MSLGGVVIIFYEHNLYMCIHIEYSGKLVHNKVYGDISGGSILTWHFYSQ